jgi:hypothetical protein
MPTEKLEKLTIDLIKKREKEANKLLLVSLIIFLVCFIGFYIIKPDLIGVTVTLLAPAIISLR